MNDTVPPPASGQFSAAPQSSLASRLFNIYAAPGDVFEEVKASPAKVGNWLVPLLLSCFLGVVFVLVMFSQPAIRQQIFEQQQKKLDEMVEQGKLTQAQADQGKQQMETIGVTLGMIFGSAGAVLVPIVWLFLLAAFVKLLGGPVFHGAVPYMKAVEIVGLAGMISALAAVVNMLLMVIKGNMMATLGPSLVIPDLEATSKLHQVLSSLNVMTLWYVGVLAVGVAKLSGATFAKAAAWLYGGWALMRVIMILIGWAASGM